MSLGNSQKNKYKVFGLTFESDISLNEFQKSTDRVDFTVKEIESSVSFKDKISSTLSFKDAEIHEKNFYCRISDGNKIEYKFKNCSNPNRIIAKIFHQPLAYMLFQRNFFILHGSAFSFRGKCIVLCGLSGSGKSESIKELSKDFKFISDDIVGVKSVNEKSICYPGLPFICSKNGHKKNYIGDSRDRSLFWVSKNSCESDNIELDQIYFLEWGNEEKIMSLNDEDAFKRLIPNSFRPLPSGASIDSEIFFLDEISQILKNSKINLFFRKKGNIRNSVDFLIRFLNGKEQDN